MPPLRLWGHAEAPPPVRGHLQRQWLLHHRIPSEAERREFRGLRQRFRHLQEGKLEGPPRARIGAEGKACTRGEVKAVWRFRAMI